jgi:hypothetical protein
MVMLEILGVLDGVIITETLAHLLLQCLLWLSLCRAEGVVA